MVAPGQNKPFLAQKPKIPEPPKRLRAAGRKFWLAVMTDFQVEPHQVELLEFAAIQVDRAAQAARRFRTATSERQRERALAGERAAMRAFQMLRRELALDSEPKETRGPRGALYR